MEKQIESADHHLTIFCDKLMEVRQLCAFLLEAYETIGRDTGAMDDVMLSGGALFARDLKRKLAELEDLLDRIRKQATPEPDPE